MNYDKYKYVQIPVAVFFMIVILSGIGYILYLAIFDYGEVPAQTYLTIHSKDTTRIAADSPQDASLKVSQVMYPSITSSNTSKPDSIIVIPVDITDKNNTTEPRDWNTVFAFAPFIKVDKFSYDFGKQ